MMFYKDKVVAFDLDGTLLDSANDLVLSLNILLREQKQKSISRNKVNSLVGNGALAMIKKAYEINANNENVNWDELKDRFLEIYKSCYTKNTKLYPYTIETLNFLKKSKFKIILVSNKPEYFVNKILDYFNITSFFNTAVAINKVPPDIAMQSISEIQLIVVFTLHFQNLLHEPVVVYVNFPRLSLRKALKSKP